MNRPLKALDAITLFITDRDRSKAFYQQLFGKTPIFEDEDSAAFKLDNVIVNLLIPEAARELVEPAHTAAPGTGASFQLSVGVENVDDCCHALARIGVPILNGPIDQPWGLRTASFMDPDGHIWEVAQPLV
jgi:catechol 2,3-dioxygenase-like lactoylglutathione lyase family enzyme